MIFREQEAKEEKAALVEEEERLRQTKEEMEETERKANEEIEQKNLALQAEAERLKESKERVSGAGADAIDQLCTCSRRCWTVMKRELARNVVDVC